MFDFLFASLIVIYFMAASITKKRQDEERAAKYREMGEGIIRDVKIKFEKSKRMELKNNV